MSENRTLSRRSFVGGGAAVAAAMAAVPAIASAGELATGSNGVPESWDKEADFVVLGSGTALPGALKAVVDGMSVIVVEKAGVTGGTTALSGGQVWTPCNRYSETPDDRELARTYMVRCADGLTTDAMIDAYLDNINPMVEMVAEEAGVEWSISPRADYHSNWEGASSDMRSLAYWIDGKNSGAYETDAETEAIVAKGGEVLLNTKATRLISRPTTEGPNEVLGVAVEDENGDELLIKANKGVLIGTGGYSRNWDMLKNWLTVPTMFSMETPTCTGDGIKMGQALGANVKMTAYIWGEACLQDVPDDECTDEYISENGPHTVRFKIYGYNSQPSAIFVNQRGERFCAESVDYDSLYYGFLGQNTTGDMEQWNWPAYFICDQKTRDIMGDSFFGVKLGEDVPEWAVQSDTIEGLAEAFGIDSEGLAAQVERWNADANAGVDTQFHRGELEYETHNRYRNDDNPPFMAIDQPPYYAAKVMPAAMGTKGGLEINEKGQVIHVSGQPIPRLYACGNTTGVGSPGKYYTGAGGTLAPGMVYGYLAAIDAGASEAWK